MAAPSHHSVRPKNPYPASPLAELPGARATLRMFQQMDRYHVDKHHRKCRPDQCRLTSAELAASRPWFVRIHRLFAQPLRTMRRRLLSFIGVRTGRGNVESETFVEAGLRKAA